MWGDLGRGELAGLLSGEWSASGWHCEQANGVTWEQMIEVGPCTSQKCVKESCIEVLGMALGGEENEGTHEKIHVGSRGGISRTSLSHHCDIRLVCAGGISTDQVPGKGRDMRDKWNDKRRKEK